MNETPRTINKWAEETFGPRTPLEIAVRANVELAELISAIQNSCHDSIVGSELADVRIVMDQIVDVKHIDCGSLGDLEKSGLKRASIQMLNDKFIDMKSSAALNMLMALIIDNLASLESEFAPEIEDEFLENLNTLYTMMNIMSESIGVNLQQSVNEKMAINRTRNWEKTETSRFQHS